MHVGMGTFFQNLGQPASDTQVHKHELGLADRAESLGLDSVWAAEHHFTDYIMCPNVAQFLTYVAARTRRVKLGSMGKSCPACSGSAAIRLPTNQLRSMGGFPKRYSLHDSFRRFPEFQGKRTKPACLRYAGT